jgi:phosphoribosyl-AMP cyclohydrolase|tara:strand:+ start:452 stop:868 length:417 start_codon:yes stop_codon:yes gene_type:complete
MKYATSTIDDVLNGSVLDFEKRGGLITAITQDADTGEVLMVAYMNRDSLRRTLETGEAVYWSTSRKRLWHKGEESGNVQVVREIRVDCDGDAIILSVDQHGGAACHTGKRSCFFNRLDKDGFCDDGVNVFDPKEVYSK